MKIIFVLEIVLYTRVRRLYAENKHGDRF